MRIKVKVLKSFEGVLEVGDLPAWVIKTILQEEPGDVNVWELGLEETATEVAVEAVK